MKKLKIQFLIEWQRVGWVLPQQNSPALPAKIRWMNKKARPFKGAGKNMYRQEREGYDQEMVWPFKVVCCGAA